MRAAVGLLVEALQGPLVLWRARPGATALLLFAAFLLTALTQIGGPVLWLCLPALLRIDRRLAGRSRAIRALAALSLAGSAYAMASLAIVPAAAAFGRVPLPCSSGSGEALGPLSLLTCALNRHYVTPSARAGLARIAEGLAVDHPGTRVSFLDASFPFFDGFPLPPHLSHGDGRKVDLALLFVEPETGRPLPGRARSSIGYWGYVPPRRGEPAPCAGSRSWLRWDFDWLQPLLPEMELDRRRTAALLARLARSPRVSAVFIEPHLRLRVGGDAPGLRFQGCAAARHDDHIHVVFR